MTRHADHLIPRKPPKPVPKPPSPSMPPSPSPWLRCPFHDATRLLGFSVLTSVFAFASAVLSLPTPILIFSSISIVSGILALILLTQFCTTEPPD